MFLHKSIRQTRQILALFTAAILINGCGTLSLFKDGSVSKALDAVRKALHHPDNTEARSLLKSLMGG